MNLACIPKVISNQGEAHEKLPQKRKDKWIPAISRDDIKEKKVLDCERVSGRQVN